MMRTRNKLLLLIIFISLLTIGAIVLYFSSISKRTTAAISSFEECVAAGYPIMESYPRQCSTNNGESFSEIIGNEMELSEEIQITNPRPNQIIISPLGVSGQAIGSWLFEGQTVMRLYDSDNNEVATGLIIAQSDWMTENFVPFYGELKFGEIEAQKGRLVIEKSNPSGLEENKKELDVPIYFK